MASREEVMAKYRKDFSEGAKRSSGQSAFWKIDPGRYQVRILPIEGAPFYLEVMEHRGLGSNTQGVLYCPTTLDPKADCEVCDFVAQIRKRGKASELATAKEIQRKQRFFANVLVRGEKKDEGPYIWSFGQTVHQALLGLMTTDYPELEHLTKGQDLTVIRTGKGRDDTLYQVYPAKKTWDVDPDVLDKMTDLEEYVESRIFSSSEMKRVIAGEDPMAIVKSRESRDEAESEPENEPEPRGRSSRRDEPEPRGRSTRREEPEPRGRSRRDQEEDPEPDRDSEPEREPEPRGRESRREEPEPRGRSSRREEPESEPEPRRGRERDDPASREIERLKAEAGAGKKRR